jgi:hypothetical protein
MSRLSQLFRWKRKVDVLDGDKVLATVYLRIVGDGEYQEARNIALQRSKELRKKLRDITSEEYNISFTDIDVMTRDEIIMAITYAEIPDYRDEAMMNVAEVPVPDMPDNPTLEQQEEHQTAVDKVKKDRIDALTSHMENSGKKRREELGKIENIEELRKLYKTAIVNTRCTELFTTVFREYCVYKGTFNDSSYKESAFDSFDDFYSSAPQLKMQLQIAYSNLEITGEDLKN